MTLNILHSRTSESVKIYDGASLQKHFCETLFHRCTTVLLMRFFFHKQRKKPSTLLEFPGQ